MFELSVACKYLIPRWRQLSVSLISLVSTLVIALVVWLIVVFFSVKDGLENSWIEKMIALTAPVRITPTEKYYQSYYYLIDSISESSDYSFKSIGEKLAAKQTDPYQPDLDEEIPKHWPAAARTQDSALKDLVKEVYQISSTLPGIKNLQISVYETGFANLKLRFLRFNDGASQQFLEHAAYVGSFDQSSALSKAMLSPSVEDYGNLLLMLGISPANIQEDAPASVLPLNPVEHKKRLHTFFKELKINTLKTPPEGWHISPAILPKNSYLQVAIILKNNQPVRMLIPLDAEQLNALLAKLEKEHAYVQVATLNTANMHLQFNGASIPLPERTPLFLEGNMELPATLIVDSIEKADHPKKLIFEIEGKLQGHPIKFNTGLGKLQISTVNADHSSFLAYVDRDNKIILPRDMQMGEPILLPRSFREGGTLAGDQGFLSYYSPTPSTMQEQRIPVFVAGFYDPGIMPVGSKYVLADKKLISSLKTAFSPEDSLASNGINIRFDHFQTAPQVKASLVKTFEENGLAPYWRVETYQEYEFTKDLIQQLQSEKNLFSLISLIIIVVACSNIISMLIILVNDKKLEIGILRSMGASSGSIACIFGFCGMVMGTLGSIIGIIAALLTLNNVNELVKVLSQFQGYDLFNPVFYGNTLPTEISTEALTFVMLTTAFISLLAGIVPAVKASLMRPSHILRAE